LEQANNDGRRSSDEEPVELGWIGTCTIILALAAAISFLAFLVYSQYTGEQQARAESAAHETFLSGLKPGDFFTDTLDGVPHCYRFASYQRLDDVQINVVTQDFDGSLSSDFLWAFGNGGEVLSASCSSADLAEYRKYQAMDAGNKRADQNEKAYLSFFHTLKKGDFFTETADKFGPAYCHEFIGISSSDAGNLQVAFKWQSDGSPFVESVLGTEYSFTRGCAKESTRQ
jgi:hypothetical protein